MATHNSLKRAIFESGKRQRAIAARTGIHYTRLSKLVNGYYPPTKDEKRELARVLRVPQSELFPEPEAVA